MKDPVFVLQIRRIIFFEIRRPTAVWHCICKFKKKNTFFNTLRFAFKLKPKLAHYVDCHRCMSFFVKKILLMCPLIVHFILFFLLLTLVCISHFHKPFDTFDLIFFLQIFIVVVVVVEIGKFSFFFFCVACSRKLNLF